jgi:hypothetical protein
MVVTVLTLGELSELGLEGLAPDEKAWLGSGRKGSSLESEVGRRFLSSSPVQAWGISGTTSTAASPEVDGASKGIPGKEWGRSLSRGFIPFPLEVWSSSVSLDS